MMDLFGATVLTLGNVLASHAQPSCFNLHMRFCVVLHFITFQYFPVAV